MNSLYTQRKSQAYSHGVEGQDRVSALFTAAAYGLHLRQAQCGLFFEVES